MGPAFPLTLTRSSFLKRDVILLVVFQFITSDVGPESYLQSALTDIFWLERVMTSSYLPSGDEIDGEI